MAKSASDGLGAASAAVRERRLPQTKPSAGSFVFGFEKNDRANISPEERQGLQSIAAADLLVHSPTQLDDAVAGGAWQEVCP